MKIGNGKINRIYYWNERACK